MGQTVLYAWKVRLLKTRVGARWWSWLRRLEKQGLGDYWDLSAHVRAHVTGKSFADVGCMWGAHGRFAFVAEEAGATVVKGIDVFGPTEEFSEQKRERSSRVEFILGDIMDRDTLGRVGVIDVVLCAGVLYHHPSPFELLVCLRQICRETLILRTSTIPEVRGLPNVAVYWPMLPDTDRQLWNLSRAGLGPQLGISTPFEPAQGYGNWFWGLTPSCLISLLKTAGFEVQSRFTEPFVETLICKPVPRSFEYNRK